MLLLLATRGGLVVFVSLSTNEVGLLLPLDEGRKGALKLKLIEASLGSQLISAALHLRSPPIDVK